LFVLLDPDYWKNGWRIVRTGRFRTASADLMGAVAFEHQVSLCSGMLKLAARFMPGLKRRKTLIRQIPRDFRSDSTGYIFDLLPSFEAIRYRHHNAGTAVVVASRIHIVDDCSETDLIGHRLFLGH
jgi:hypothetical protein